jgi:hypothetical protein
MTVLHALRDARHLDTPSRCTSCADSRVVVCERISCA